MRTGSVRAALLLVFALSSCALFAESGADPNKLDSDGRTEMHRPYLCDGEIRALAEAGGDVNAVCGKGLTPLMYAVSDYEAECVYSHIKELLELGADPLRKTPGGKDLLLCYLERFPADIRYNSRRGYPPPYTKTVKLLLDTGINPAESDSGGQSALRQAFRLQGKRPAIKSLHKMVSAAAFAAAEDKTEIAAVKRVIREENRRALAQTIRDPGTYVGAIPLALALGYIGYAAVARENIYRGKPYDNWVAKVNAAATGAVAGAAVSVVPPLLSMSGEGGALWGVLVLAAAGTCGWWMSTRSEMFHNDAFLYYGTSVLLTMPLWIWYL